MQDQDEQDTRWGAHINASWPYRSRDCPDWANPAQCESWNSRGVIVWDDEAQRIARLGAIQVLRILDHLRTNDDWKQHGFIVGQPATQIWLDDPEREPEPVLTNRINLSTTQTQEFFELLQSHEGTLQQMADEEEEGRRRLAKVYDILLKLGREENARKETE